MKEKIGIIGRGNVAKALAGGLERAGYDIRMGGKGSASETAQWADILVLAVPYSEAPHAMSDAGSAADGKIVIDTTNPLNQDFQLSVGFTTSAAEEIQKAAPKSTIVKCFNTAFSSTMSDGKAKGEQISAFVAGDDADARKLTCRIAADIGYDAVDAGVLEHARWIEALAFLNIQLGFTQNMGTYIGFKLVH